MYIFFWMREIAVAEMNSAPNSPERLFTNSWAAWPTMPLARANGGSRNAPARESFFGRSAGIRRVYSRVRASVALHSAGRRPVPTLQARFRLTARSLPAARSLFKLPGQERAMGCSKSSAVTGRSPFTFA